MSRERGAARPAWSTLTWSDHRVRILTSVSFSLSRFLVVFLLSLFVMSVEAAVQHSADPSGTAFWNSNRRRPARPIAVRDWLRENSLELASSDLVADTSDLQPVRTWLTGVKLIGLGDGTHGTHEYYTIKKRLIEFLAREEGVTVVMFEGGWAEFNEITHYLLTGQGSPRELLRSDGYFFWEYKEMIDLLLWARSFNEQRGARPPLTFRGVDNYPFGSRTDVLNFFQQVDPAYKATAAAKYNCGGGVACFVSAQEVRRQLLDNRQRYQDASSVARFLEVLQSARVAEQWHEASTAPQGNAAEYRERFMAENISTVFQMYEPDTRAFFWGHNEHVGKNFLELSENPASNTQTRSTGNFLNAQFGNQYYVFGSAFLEGSFIAIRKQPYGLLPHVMQSASQDSYESIFAQAARSKMIVNLRVTSPPLFLSGPRPLRHGQAEIGQDANGFNVPLRLLEKFDGVIYFDFTTPATVAP
jgi:erythromycin esterase